MNDYHIAFFTNTYFPFVGGVSRSIALYSDYLRQRGHQVRIYAPQYENAEEDSDDVRRIVSLTDFHDSGFSLPSPVSSKPRWDMQNDLFDLVHVHHPFILGEMGMRVARQENLPIVFTYHTQYEQYTHYAPMNEETAARTIIRHATAFCNLCDLVIAPTEGIRSLLRKRGVEGWIEVLPSGVELSPYDEATPDLARERLGIAKEDTLLLHVGRLAKEKNLHFLVGAVLKAMSKLDKAQFVIAGQGEEEEALRVLAGESGISQDRIHFVGMMAGKELVDLYVAADLFVFSSCSETQGMVLVEAMAGATPVIALDADAIRDLVVDGSNGRLLPGACSEEDFAAAIVDAANAPDALRAWAKQARDTAAAFDMPLLASRLESLYKELKLLPRHHHKQGTMSFGLIGSFIETIWEDISRQVVSND
jgi:1,2-diacylglycerol 3-alpha-glucosyltransferase